ncbi:MAG: alpha/beta fold hydrolase, partial [Verrucomicrobiota bacterium]
MNRYLTRVVLPAAAVVVLSQCQSLDSGGESLAGLSVPTHGRETAVAAELPPETKFVKESIQVRSGADFPTWRTRSRGKPILLLHPINGLSAPFLRFALELEDWGYRVYLPSLYGDPIDGGPFDNIPAYGFDRELPTIRFLKASQRWNPVDENTVGPIEDDIALLADTISRREGGAPIAVIGNSLTGMIPLQLMERRSVRVGVLAQPATPVRKVGQIMLRLPLTNAQRFGLSLTDEQLERSIVAMRRDPRKQLLGFQYGEDPLASLDKFNRLHEELAQAGLSNRLRLFLKEPASSESSAAKLWVTRSDTTEEAGMLLPHSTFLDAPNLEDRRW